MALVAFVPRVLPAESGPSVFEHFITRDGDRLMQGAAEFRFGGVNMPGMTVPYDYTLRIPERLILPTAWEQEDGFKTLNQMGARVLRLWNLPMRGPKDEWMDWAYVQGPGKFNEEAFKTIDRLLALANRYGVRVIFPFTAEAGDYLGGIGTYADWRGKERQAFFTDPQLKADYQATIAYVINRRNTVTGQFYRDDKAILAWEFGNELRRAPLAWEAEMATFIKSIDPNHLVMAGNDSRIPEHPPEDLDIVTRHYYGGDWVKQCRGDRARSKGQRPFIIGEYGGTSDDVATRLFYEEALANGTAGHLNWSMTQHHRFGGYYWHQIFTRDNLSSFHWAGNASGSAYNEKKMLWTLRDYAFRMAGAEPPAVLVPDAPQWLPVEDLPLFSWRGAAGATGYDIARAESATGPWVTVATDVSDANVAYRPLWHDRTAVPQRDYYYRISARNTAGVSRPSTAMGPVCFRTQVVVDEFADLETCRAHSDGLELRNDHNGLYGEYLYRAKGEAGAEIEYEFPGDATAVRIWAFHDGDILEPHLSVAAPQGEFAPIALRIGKAERLRVMAKVKQLARETRILLRYEATLTPVSGETGPRRIRLKWAGPMELDRIEIEHRVAGQTELRSGTH